MHITPKARKKHLADKYWEQRSEMLLPPTEAEPCAVSSVMLSEEASWISLGLPAVHMTLSSSRRYAYICNSTLGLLSLLR